ncbi:MAG: DUF167 domain-containing protein [Planctomycetia bacterium]|nr:MAG: DUF167 domain-containing protein [Planctomycetia bacterium]
MSAFDSLVVSQEEGGVAFGVKVVPGASRSRMVGVLGDVLKIAVAEPPEDGRANAAVQRLLAERLGVPAAAVDVVSGHSSPRKRIRVRGLSRSRLIEALRRDE